jgi:hypothetical protein
MNERRVNDDTEDEFLEQEERDDIADTNDYLYEYL